MIKLEVISIAVVSIFFWIDYAQEVPVKIIRNLRLKLHFKPFNCLFCLSFWTGLILAISLQEPIYISLPIITKLIDK